MPHWAEQFVGIPCGRDTTFDCADLAMLVQQKVFGRTIVQPEDRKTYAGHEGHVKFSKMAEEIAIHKEQYVTPTEKPEEGDPVLLKVRGFLQHIGVYCRIGGETYILHAADGHKQVVLQRLRDMHVRGLDVGGYYKWK